MIALPDRFFVAGTDTGIGKTIVSAILVSGLGASYWKPIQSGLEEVTDSEFVQRLSAAPAERILPERFRLTRPLSPHLSARYDGKKIHLSDFSLPELPSGSRLVVEAAGGLLVPLNENDLMIDLIGWLALPVVLVAKSGLGTINHTLLSLEALSSRKIPVIGVVVNGDSNPDNCQSIAHYGKVEILAQIPRLALDIEHPESGASEILETYKRCFTTQEESIKI